MNKANSQSPTSPFSYFYIDIICIILTLLFYWIISLIDAPFFKWFYALIQQRGPIQYLIIYVVIRNVVSVIIAKTRKELPVIYFKQLCIFSFMPLLFGLIGAVQGLGAGFGYTAPYLASDKVIVLKDILANIVLAAAVSIDTLFLGLLGTVFCLGIYTNSLSLTHKCVQQSGPGYPPQGVGSPDP